MDEIIDFAGIGDFIDSPVKVYSSGMYVRLGFSIAVTAEPEILIVDEIIAVGDEEFQRKCFDYLYELRRQGTTIVIVSHSLPVVADLCDQAVWLDHGRMQAVGESATWSTTTSGGEPKEAVGRPAPDRPRTANERHAAPGRARSGSTSSSISTRDGAVVPLPGRWRARPRSGCTTSRAADLPRSSSAWASSTSPGVNIAGPNSGYGERAFKVAAGRGLRRLHDRPHLPLQPGVFLVSTAVVDRGHTYDYHDRAYELRVRADMRSHRARA